MGGLEIGERTFEEGGHLLQGTVYAWTNIVALASNCRASC